MSNKNIRTLSATTVPALSSLPGNIDPALKTFLNGLVQALEIRLGRRGDPRDRAVTLRELIDSGLAKELSINPYDPNAVGFTIPTGADTNVLTTSVTTPTGLTAVGGFTLVLLKWDLHSHLDHSHTEIWRHTSDDRNNSIHIGNAEFTRFFSDQSVVADTTYYYWIRHANEQGVISDWNAESGVSATTQPDIDFLLTLLTDEIRSTHLFNTLATDVGRIPGWHTIIGNYTISGPTAGRTLGVIDGVLDGWHEIIGSYNNDRTLTEINDGIDTLVINTATQLGLITGVQNSIYVDGDPASGLRIALASALVTLTSTVSTNTGGIATNVDDIVLNTTATTEVRTVLWLNGNSSNPLLLATASALSTTNSNVSNLNGNITANASDIDDLEASVDHPTTGIAAQGTAIDALEVTVNSTTNGVLVHGTKITNLEATVNDATDGVAASATAIDGLEVKVNHTETGTEASAAKITSLEATVNNATTGVAAHGTAIDGLTVVVSGPPATGLVGKVTSLELTVNNATTGVGALGTAVDNLELTVDSTTNGVIAHGQKITTLELAVNNTTTGVLASASAIDDLELTVNSTTNGVVVHGQKIVTLEGTVNNSTTGLNAQGVAIDDLELTVDSTTNGVVVHGQKIGILEGVVNDTETGVVVSAGAIDALEITVNHTTTGVSASATKIGALEVSVDHPTEGLEARSSLWDQQIVKIGYSYQPNQSNRLFDNAGAIKSQADATAYNTNNSPNTTSHTNYVAWRDGMPMALASTQIEVADGTGAYHTLEEQATIVSGTDGLLSQYTVKIETLGSGASARKVVGGFGLSAEPNLSSGSYNINFGILADKFFIEAPAGNQSTTRSTITPFSVVTSAQTFTDSAGNDTTLPSGVYMDAAHIAFASITEAHIGVGVIDTIHCGVINGEVINAGEINATFINLDNATISEDNGAIIIKDLGVDTAQINNLAVGTLKIADEAATIPYGVSSGGGITIGYNSGENITNWTAIDGGGVVQNYSSNVPSQVSIIVTQNFVGGSNSSGQDDNVIDMALRVSSDGGSTWLTGTGTDLGRVVHSSLEDYAFTLTSGFTFAPTGTGNVKVRLYARKWMNQSSWKTKNAHFIILGTRK